MYWGCLITEKALQLEDKQHNVRQHDTIRVVFCRRTVGIHKMSSVGLNNVAQLVIVVSVAQGTKCVSVRDMSAWTSDCKLHCGGEL
jgi:hypothetical protein